MGLRDKIGEIVPTSTWNWWELGDGRRLWNADSPHTPEEALQAAILGPTWGGPVPVQIEWWVSEITVCWFWMEPEYQALIPTTATDITIKGGDDGWWIGFTTPDGLRFAHAGNGQP